MLEDIRKCKEPPLSGQDSAYFLNFGSILLNAVEFFDTFMVILSQISVES